MSNFKFKKSKSRRNQNRIMTLEPTSNQIAMRQLDMYGAYIEEMRQRRLAGMRDASLAPPPDFKVCSLSINLLSDSLCNRSEYSFIRRLKNQPEV